MAANKVSVSEFYRGRSVLITGATGFIGKVLIEKLLRSCESIENIYILLRPKKSLEPKERLEELFTSEVFHRVRHECPEVLSKVVPITGDMDLPELNMGESDMDELRTRVSVVFHLAASVRFDEPLKVSLVTNVLGTKEVMTLCRKLPYLQAVVHLSTAFCNCDRDVIEEKIYPFSTMTNQIIDTIKWLDEDSVNILAPRLIGEKLNSYAYTKAMTETFLAENYSDLPLTIVRPSIVTCSWKEPQPGWIDCLHGGTGIILAVMQGVLRSVYCKPEKIWETVPVDSVVNCAIVAAWYIGTNSSEEIPVYNCVASSLNKLTWREAQAFFRKCASLYPSEQVFRDPPNYVLINNRQWDIFWKVVSHTIPAYCLDWALVLLRKKRRFVRLYDKLHCIARSLEPFTTREWIFMSRNLEKLHNTMNPSDRMKFGFDLRGINWEMYVENYLLGIRKYLLKEDPSSIPSARKSLQKRKIYRHAVYAVLCWTMICISAYFWPTHLIFRRMLPYLKI